MTTLIHTILQRLEHADTNPSAIVNLNTLLKTNPGFFIQDGGLGDEYEAIAKFLTINEDGLITAIKSQEISQFAQETLAKAISQDKKKLAYKAGICFALIVAFSHDVANKLKSFQSLCTLFDKKGYLVDEALHQICNSRLEPIPANGEFFPNDRILWSWQIKGEKEVSVFEMQRQQKIEQKTGFPSIRGALLILGLTDNDALTKEAVNQVCTMYKDTLKKLMKLSKLDSIKHPLIIQFNDAYKVLIEYVDFKNFNSNQPLEELKAKVALIGENDLSSTLPFIELHKLFNDKNREINAIVTMVEAGDAYIDGAMVIKRLGTKSFFNQQYKLQTEFFNLSKDFANLINVKIDNLLAKARTMLSTRSAVKLSQDAISSMNSVVAEINNARTLLHAIKGDATDENSVVAEAYNFDAKDKILQQLVIDLQERMDQHDQQIKNSIIQMISLLKTLSEKPQTQLFDTTVSRLSQIDAHLTWLSALDAHSKPLAEQEIGRNVFSQTTPEQVTEALSTVILGLDEEFRAKAMRSILGTTYNKNLPTTHLLNSHLKRKMQSDQNLLEILTLILEGMKNSEIPIRVTAKELVPAPVMMSFDNLENSLNEKRIELKLQIDNEIQNSLNAVSKSYEEAMKLIENINKNQNLLDFDIGKNFEELQSKVQEFEDLFKKLPVNSIHSNVVDAKFKKMLSELNINKTEFTKHYTQIKSLVKETQSAASTYKQLKERIKERIKAYTDQGGHHADRGKSTDRLFDQIDIINAANGLSIKQRISALLKQIQVEEIKTAQSHQRIGFFGKWRPCRLQKLYMGIIQEFAADVIYTVASTATDAELAHQKRVDHFISPNSCFFI
ncbi:MAG: hypothetical protein WC627_08285 [Legionella sp.]|jgi:hypothetical protein